MRSLFCLIICIFIMAAHADDDFKCPIYSRVSGYGATNTWFVAKSRIEKSKGWDEKSEPPLSVGKAVRLQNLGSF